jgi:hypothetical protein
MDQLNSSCILLAEVLKEEVSSCFVGCAISFKNFILILRELFDFIFFHPSFFNELFVGGHENNAAWRSELLDEFEESSISGMNVIIE